MSGRVGGKEWKNYLSLYVCMYEVRELVPTLPNEGPVLGRNTPPPSTTRLVLVVSASSVTHCSPW